LLTKSSDIMLNMENNKVLLKVGCLDQYEFLLNFYTPSEDEYLVVEYPWEYGESCNLFNNLMQTAIQLSIDFKCDIFVSMDSFICHSNRHVNIKWYNYCVRLTKAAIIKWISRNKNYCNLILFNYNRAGTRICNDGRIYNYDNFI